MEATVSYQAVTLLSDNICINFLMERIMGLQQMIDEKNTFLYLVDFVRLQILQFLQGHHKKIINFVNFIAEFNPGYVANFVSAAY